MRDRRTDRITRAVPGIIAAALIANLAQGLRAPATAQGDQPPVGKYQVAAPVSPPAAPSQAYKG